MKRKIFAAGIIAIVCLCLGACGHEHTWTDATCTAPKTCSECGETEGEALGHTWIEATCTEPKTCSVCGITAGIPLGHEVETWETVKEATCKEKGERKGTCSICQKEVTEETDLAEHVPGEWVIETEATYSTPGMWVKKCVNCGEVIEQEAYELTEDEKAAWYKSNCGSVSYSELARNPDSYTGTYVYFTGRVIQVLESSYGNTVHYRINVTNDGWGYYDDTVYVEYEPKGSSRILEDDMVTFYGEYYGLYTYESVLGAKITIPAVVAEYIDLQ